MSSAAAGPYLDTASGVLRNLLGITDAAELARAEAALSASRLTGLERRPRGHEKESRADRHGPPDASWSRNCGVSTA